VKDRKHLIGWIIRQQDTQPGNLRTGQILFNLLPRGAGGKVAGTFFDPFHKELCYTELQQWIDNHLIFDDDGAIIGVFNNNQLLWEAQQWQ
jgi:hypothetical protein